MARSGPRPSRRRSVDTSELSVNGDVAVGASIAHTFFARLPAVSPIDGLDRREVCTKHALVAYVPRGRTEPTECIVRSREPEADARGEAGPPPGWVGATAGRSGRRGVVTEREAVATAPYTTISASTPAFLTLYWRSRVGRPLIFDSLAELAEVFEARTEESQHFPARWIAPWFARGLCDGRRKVANLRPPFLVVLAVDESRTSLFEVSQRLHDHAVAHFGYETGARHGQVGPGPYSPFLIVTDLLASSWGALKATTKALGRLAGLKPSSVSSRSWTDAAFRFPTPVAPPGVRQFVGDLRGDWMPSSPSRSNRNELD